MCTLLYFVLIYLRNKVQTSQKNTGECFTTKLKSTRKNSGTFEGKNFTWKSHLHHSCTKPFIYVGNLIHYEINYSNHVILNFNTELVIWTAITLSNLLFV